MWERVKKLSSQNKDAVRVTLSQDSKEISEKMKQAPDADSKTIESTDDVNDSTVKIPAYDANSGENAESNDSRSENSENANESEESEESEDAEGNDIQKDTQEIDSEEQNEDDDSPEDEIKKLESENKDFQDRLLRLSAEFENFKKRNRREMSEFKKFASEVLIKDLLAVVDNLDRALETASADEACKAIIDGVSMTRDEMLKVFSKYGVKTIEALEKEFDPAFHQAVGQEENADSPKNTILKEYQKGYTIHGRLLRPSMVIVSS